ncbi:MAG TPA: hypothetical protein VNL77_19870 [Roseiflexaceae bacterium]|nr:hypothetical protein [Roseiflexaceae bacterium]
MASQLFRAIFVQTLYANRIILGEVHPALDVLMRRQPLGLLAGFEVCSHGDEKGPLMWIEDGPVHCSVEELATIIEAQRGFVGQTVYLRMCEVGKGTDSFAQRLANRLGVPVAAPTARIFNDDLYTLIDDGCWHIFEPQPNPHR